MRLELVVRKEERKTVIHLGESLLPEMKRHLLAKHHKNPIVLLVDANVLRLHGRLLRMHLQEFRPLIVSVPSGEHSKTREMKARVEDTLLQNGIGKDSVIIAIGGGVTGDLAGFVASTFSRGVPFINVPTTLLAMVDASIGGKTGVNTSKGKNLIGTFFPSEAVFIDTHFLKTLSEPEFKAGLVEVLKIALARDARFFRFLQKNAKSILRREPKALLEVIHRSVALKKAIVEADPEERGPRQVLNVGHTMGHALEASSQFRISHGEAVVRGMLFETLLAQKAGCLSPKERKEILATFTRFGFPVNARIPPLKKLALFLAADKKSKQGKPRFVLLKGIGKTVSTKGQHAFEVRPALIRACVEELHD
ncbi:MAG: 3-dehydroquinate synthase [Nanoarchaeota archaeon]|nr:3-dehydroquinate synthase [Nanoarchaeota archaeon]